MLALPLNVTRKEVCAFWPSSIPSMPPIKVAFTSFKCFAVYAGVPPVLESSSAVRLAAMRHSNLLQHAVDGFCL